MKTKKIILIHHNMNIIGGAEKVALAISEALYEAGYKIYIATAAKINWKKIKKYFGYNKQIDEFYIIPLEFNKFEIFQRILMLFFKKSDFDLIINTFGDAFTFSHIIYIHYPSMLLVNDEIEQSTGIKKRIIKQIYLFPYLFLQKYLSLIYIKQMIVLTNSTISAEAIRKIYGKKPIILYPPIDFKTFYTKSILNKDNNLVVTVSRFHPLKKLENILYVAKFLPYIKFIIAGSVRTQIEEDYYREIKKQKMILNVKNVSFILNPSIEELKEIYKKASIYLHTMPREHFGISVLEAMSSGCVPLVSKKSGTWIDIIDRGKYGYGFNDLTDLAYILRKLTTSDKPSTEFRYTVQKRAKEFSKERFSKKIVTLVEKLLNQ